MNESKDPHHNESSHPPHHDTKDHHNPAPIFKEFNSDDALSRYDLKKAFLGAQRHILTILITSLLFTSIGAFLVYRYMKSYSADALVLFEGNTERKLPGGYTMSNLALPSAVEMIKLQTNLYAVRSLLGLDMSIPELEKMIRVDVPKGTSNLIWITVKGDHPNLVVDIANTLAKVTVKDSQEFTRREIQRVRDSFSVSYESSKQNLNVRLNDIEVYKKANDYFEMDAQFASLLNRANMAKQSYQAAELNYNSMLEEYQSLKSDVMKLPEQIPATDAISGQDNPFQSRMSALEAALIDARSKYSEQNPKIQILQDEMNNLRKQALSSSQDANSSEAKEKGYTVKNPMKLTLEIELLRMYGKVKAAEAMKEDLEKNNEKLQLELKTIPEKQLQLAKLLQAKELAEREVDFFKSSLQSLDIMLQSPKGYIEVFQLADKAKNPVSSWTINLIPLLMLFFGAFVGYCIAAVKELMTQTLCTKKEIELAYHIPCLVRIPEMKGLNRQNGQEKTIYYIRKLVEHIQHINHSAHAYSSILIASSISREGKSCITYYLALYYQKLGKKTVIVDFDYRRNPFIEMSSRASLDSYLHGEAQLEDIISHGPVDSIKIIKSDMEMNELIKSSKTTDFLADLKTKYDLIIIEAPGMLEDDYSLNLASSADMCLLVVGSSKVKKQQVDTALRELDLYEKRPLGIILNRVLDIYMGDVNGVRTSRKSEH